MARSGLVPLDQSKLSMGMLVSYATSAGATADDGAGRNSPYAEALAKRLRAPGEDVGLMLRRVRADVLQATGQRQRPEIVDNLNGPVILAGPVQPGPPGRVDDPRADDTALWAAVRDSNRADDFEAYLRRFPQGLYADLARIRLRVLQPSPEGRSFNVVNRTGMNLTALHAVRSPLGAQQEWGRSLLASNRPVRPDASYGVSPADGAGCRFDLRVVLADGRESVLLNQDICTRRELEMAAPPRPPIVPPHDPDEQPGATEIGRFKAWTAAAYVTRGQKTCYAFTDAAGNFEPKQNPVMLMVSHRPSARDTVLISAGYPFPAGAKVLVTIGATQVPFDTVGKTAAAQQGAAVVASMRNGPELRAAGAGPGNGEQVTYSFPLAGFAAAYEAISRSCPPSPQPAP
ncbi:caspase family protein [Dankookia sp. P2]|uniref:caspase family protein n=1 Tax=Dankookia sp. P2 TaxID=3423955 RepID=UPI003D66DE94